MKDDTPKLNVTKPATVAAGIKAVTNAMKVTTSKMGVGHATRGLLKLNQKGGIDCQSCAWPDPDGRRSIGEFCESGSKALADEGTKKRITAEFFAKYSVEELCEKGDYWLNDQGRLTEPMVLRNGGTHYEPISWDDAFAIVANELNSLASPDEAVFYTSGRTSNEAAFLYQLFVRQFGTNNLPDCSNMCHESSSVALTESIGIGKATVRLSDFNETDLVIVIGQNPGTNAPRMMSSLQDAKRNGAKMIAINPLPEAGLLNFINPNPQQYANPLEFPIAILGRATKFADLHLPVKIGGDRALLKGVMKVIVEQGQIDHEFIAEFTDGFDDLIANLDATSWDELVAISGIGREQIEEAADMFIAADRVITCWAMGITQHKDAVATIQDVVNLHLLRGQIGKPGAGVCPVRGHSNVQGDRTMGIWERPTDQFLDALEREFAFTAPREHGYSTVEAIEAMHRGEVKVFFTMGGNLVSAAPDTEVVFDALRKCELTAQVITKLNRTALATGKTSLILPCLGRSEMDRDQFVSTESTMLNVQSSIGIFEPASKHLRSEPWIVCSMAKATLGKKSSVDWDAMAADYDNIRNAIERVIPGFENYNRRIREPGGFYLDCPPRDREFRTASGRARFISQSLTKIDVATDRLLLTTIRSHDQFNTTIYGFNDRYRGIAGGRRVIFMNEADIAERSLAAGSVVDITSHFDDGERHANSFTIVPYPIPKGCAAAYFPEANPLVPLGSYADRSLTPTSKSIVISIKATGETAGEFDLK
ncbi:MAG TPA: FdhF/YdeP family oxidoreductase [Pyrinomonadaceae bacterium]|nr:FdhF/YdeP family oxidoreductase [Pyrinomonadaceae bacterium]